MVSVGFLSGKERRGAGEGALRQVIFSFGRD